MIFTQVSYFLTLQTFLQHPEDESAIENRDYTINRLSEVLKTVARLADGENPENIQKDLDNSDEETILPPSRSSLPSSPTHPPGSHVYPIEYHLSPPSMLPHSPAPMHGMTVPVGSSQTLSSDEDMSMESSGHYHRRPHHNHRVSGEYDHLHTSRRESGQYDHMNSQDTYSSSSSFSPYRPGEDSQDESAVDISKRAQYLTGEPTSRMYQVSSGTLPTVELNSTQISSTHEYTRQGQGQGDQNAQFFADSTQGVASAATGKNAKDGTSLQVSRGGNSSGHSYPRGHTHSSKISVSSSAVATGGLNYGTHLSLVPQTGTSRMHQSPSGQEHSVNASFVPGSSATTGQPSKGVGVNVPHRPVTLSSSAYPRGHTHLKSLPLSPTRAVGPPGMGAYVGISSPPKSVEKSIEKFEV